MIIIKKPAKPEEKITWFGINLSITDKMEDYMFESEIQLGQDYGMCVLKNPECNIIDYLEDDCILLKNNGALTFCYDYKPSDDFQNMLISSIIKKSTYLSAYKNITLNNMGFHEFYDGVEALILASQKTTEDNTVLENDFSQKFRISNFLIRIVGMKQRKNGVSFIIGLHILYPYTEMTNWIFREIKEEAIKNEDVLLSELNITNIMFQVYDSVLFWQYFRSVINSTSNRWVQHDSTAINFLTEFTNIIIDFIKDGSIIKGNYTDKHIGYMDATHLYINSTSFCDYCKKNNSRLVFHDILTNSRKLYQEAESFLEKYDKSFAEKTVPGCTQRFFRISLANWKIMQDNFSKEQSHFN